MTLLCGIPLFIGIVIAKAVRGTAEEFCLAVCSLDDQGYVFHFAERTVASECYQIAGLALDE